MFQFNQELTNMVFIFIVIFFGLYQYKHTLMFTESGEMKQFGTGKQKTICPIWMASILLITLVYILMITLNHDHI
jgi:hypothetical protein